MKKMRRIASLVLAGAMAASTMTGCSSDKGNTAADATQAAQKAETAAAQEAATTAAGAAAETAAENTETASGDITSWILEDTSLSGKVRFYIPFKGSAGMDDMIAEFNKTYPNIEVVLNTYNNNSDGNMALNIAMQSGECDVVASFGLSNAFTRWENDMYMDLTDKCAEEGIDLVANWGTDKYKYDDKIYTFPCGGLSYYVAINMDAWNEAGLGELPAAWTWDEYLEACKAMTKVNGDGTVAVYGGSDYHSVNYFTYCNAQVQGKNPYYDEDGTSSFDNPIIVNALKREYQAEIVDKIWYPKSVYRGDNLQTQMTFCDGVVASAINPNMTRFLHDTEGYPNVNWVTGFAPFPTEEEGQTNYMSGVVPFSHAGISIGCQDEDAAWAWLKWYSTYGVKYLVCAGHQPNWKGTEAGSAVELIYGSKEEAEKWIDVESFTRVVGNPENPAYYEDQLAGYSEVNDALTEYTMYALNGEMSVEEAMAEATKIADDAIKAAK